MYEPLVIISWILTACGAIWIVCVAWQRSVIWGAACFVIPVCQLFYVALHWREAKQPFFLLVAGFVVRVLAESVK
jgi:hypothetical protein